MKQIAIMIMVGTVALLTVAANAVEMKAGVAKTVITNDTPLVMVNGNVSEGTLHDIYARALVLNDGATRFVIVTYDLNCLDVATPILRKRVRDELGIDPSRLILLATHNHNAPIQIVPDNFDYGRLLADKIFTLIQEAISAERGPVRLLFGSGHADFVKASGNAEVDTEVQVLEVVHGEKPLAVLFNHGTHPKQASEKKVGAGHPGYAVDDVEAAIPGVQAMYADACGGNQFAMDAEGFREKKRLARKKGKEHVAAVAEENAKALGSQLAEAVLGVLDSELVDVTGPITSSMEVLSLPLGPPISREEALELAKDFPPDLGFVPYPHKGRSTNWVRMLLYWYDKGLPFPTTTADMVCTDDTYFVHKKDAGQLEKYDYSIHDEFPCEYEEVIVSKLGPLVFVAMQGEVCGPIGTRIKDSFRKDTPIMVSSYMGEHNLYIPTREIVRLNVYQAKVIHIQYASPVPWAPEVEDEMVNGVCRMVRTALEE